MYEVMCAHYWQVQIGLPGKKCAICGVQWTGQSEPPRVVIGYISKSTLKLIKTKKRQTAQ